MRTWIRNPDGEYNEQSTVVHVTGHKPKKVIVYSDRDGLVWDVTVGRKSETLEANNESDARAEAIRWAHEVIAYE